MGRPEWTTALRGGDIVDSEGRSMKTNQGADRVEVGRRPRQNECYRNRANRRRNHRDHVMFFTPTSNRKSRFLST